MSFSTIYVKVVNFFTQATYAKQIASLKTAITNDYNYATEAAHRDLDTGLQEIEGIAKKELSSLNAMVQSASVRIQALLSHNVLVDDEQKLATDIDNLLNKAKSITTPA